MSMVMWVWRGGGGLRMLQELGRLATLRRQVLWWGPVLSVRVHEFDGERTCLQEPFDRQGNAHFCPSSGL